jgi:hypothetical protein
LDWLRIRHAQLRKPFRDTIEEPWRVRQTAHDLSDRQVGETGGERMQALSPNLPMATKN